MQTIETSSTPHPGPLLVRRGEGELFCGTICLGRHCICPGLLSFAPMELELMNTKDFLRLGVPLGRATRVATDVFQIYPRRRCQMENQSGARILGESESASRRPPWLHHLDFGC